MRTLSNLQAHVALLIVALIYGGNYIIAKEVMNQNYIGPLGFVLLRAITALILFWIFHALFVKERMRPGDIGWAAVCGMFGVAINQAYFFSGLALTTPIHSALIMTMTPIIVMLLSTILLAEKITMRKLAGIFLGGAGAALLILFGKELMIGRDMILGDFMILVNATSYGLYLVLVKRLLKKYHPITVIKWVFTFGFVYLLPLGWNELGAVDFATFTFPVWLGVLYVLILVSFTAYLLNVLALKTVSPTVVSIYIYLQPFLASVLSLAVGMEDLNLVKVIAGACIFAGVYLVSTRASNRATPEDSAAQ